MCGVDIGIDAKRDRRANSFRAGNRSMHASSASLSTLKLKTLLVERVFDFLPRLTDAGEGAFSRIAAGRDHAKEFAAGDDVEPGAGFPGREILESRDLNSL